MTFRLLVIKLGSCDKPVFVADACLIAWGKYDISVGKKIASSTCLIGQLDYLLVPDQQEISKLNTLYCLFNIFN